MLHLRYLLLDHKIDLFRIIVLYVLLRNCHQVHQVGNVAAFSCFVRPQSETKQQNNFCKQNLETTDRSKEDPHEKTVKNILKKSYKNIRGQNLLFVGLAIPRCLSTTQHPMNKARGSILLVVYSMIIRWPTILYFLWQL